VAISLKIEATCHNDRGGLVSQLVIIDDDLAIRALLRTFFEGLHHQVQCFENLACASDYIFAHSMDIDLIIADLRLPDGTGLDLMPRLRARQIDVPVILITAFGSTEIAANALKQGLFDYITKPLNLTELEVLCNRAIKMKNLERSLLDLRANATESSRFNGLVGRSMKMTELFELIEKVASTSSSVLIQGESGTGKELVARALHEHGSRSGKKFVALNCSAIPFELLESELFGYKRGAFTGANDDREGLFSEADGGTLFLDEIGDMPPLLQAKLLRVLQEKTIRRLGENVDRTIDVRIIAATHKDLKTAIQRKEFREDLYFRLCVIKLNVPALSERREDIPLLAGHFMRKYAALNGKAISGFTREAMHQLMQAPWPGNVRELENAIERAVALCMGSTIDESDLNIDASFAPPPNNLDKLFSRLLTLKELEREYIHHVLTTTSGKKEQVAAILGIDRKTLYRKEREYDLHS
jgi:DNA-binding NtrC family response regulator